MEEAEAGLEAPRAEEIIRAQFPEMRPLEVRWLGEGCDSTVFEVGGKWAFRFPKRSDVEQQLLLEMRLLPVLGAQSPLPVPEFCFRGAPSQAFPRHFGGYRKIPGVPAIRIDPGRIPLDTWAPALARFLSWLHAFPRDQAARLGVPQQQVDSIIDEARAEVLAGFDQVARMAPGQPLEEWFRFLTDGPGARIAAAVSPCLVHADLAADHVLCDLDTESITGVIDWSDVAVGDPSLDLAGVIHCGGARLLDAVLSTYDGPADEATRDRALYLAACRGVGDVVFGLETGRSEYVEAGVRALTQATSARRPGRSA